MQPVIPVASRWRNDDLIFAANHIDRVGRVHPPSGDEQVRVLLQRESRRGHGPGHDGGVRARQENSQQRRTRRLHGEQTPEPTGDRIIPASHRATSIRLADGTDDGINAARARAAATVYGGPVNRIALGQRSGFKQNRNEHQARV